MTCQCCMHSCKALEGQVFAVDDVPVIPIHPRCHCSYCVPAEGDDAEITASGTDLDSVYADAGVKGYERVPESDGKKIVFSISEIRGAPDMLQIEAAETTKSNVPKDVTTLYAQQSGKGIVTYGDGYRINNHTDEIETAKWITKTFGGEIELIPEDSTRQKKTPDYMWNDELWERKGISSAKAADSAVRKALHQLGGRNGGIVLIMNEDMDISDLEKVIEIRMRRSNKARTDIMIVQKEKLIKAIRYIKR